MRPCMSSKKRREERKAREQKNIAEQPKTLSSIDIERQKNLSRKNAAEIKKNDMVREVLTRTNGEFTGEQRKLFELYLFEDKSAEETMRGLGTQKDERGEPIPVSANYFYRLVEQTMKKMREHIKNFNF